MDKLAQAASGQMPARQLDKAEMRQVVRSAMESLWERQRLAVLLNKFEGMSYADIAETMELSLAGGEVAVVAGPGEPPRGVGAVFSGRRAAAVGHPMSEPQKQLDPNLQEQLVAYLDGELDAESRRRVEEMLANDPRVRGSMQKLDRTWELLDELDAAPPGENFTHTTLEMVAAAAAEDARRIQAGAPRRRRRRWLLLAAGMLAAGAAGFLVVAAIMPDPNRQLLQDLPLLENLNQYRQIDSLDFLRRLIAEKVFAEEGEASDEPAESLAERRERIQNMSAAQKDQLLRRQRQFQALEAEQQQRVRLFHEQLRREPDGEKLRETLAQYGQWLAGLPSIRRITLEELEPGRRIAQVKQIRREQANAAGWKANAEDRQALLDWMRHYAQQHETRFLKSLPEERRQQLSKMRPEARQRVVLALMCQRWQWASPVAPWAGGRRGTWPSCATRCRRKRGRNGRKSPPTSNGRSWPPGSGRRRNSSWPAGGGRAGCCRVSTSN